MTRSWFRSNRLLLVAPALVVLSAFAVQASTLETEINLTIPAGQLSPALITFSNQSNVQVLTRAGDISALRTPGVQGRMSVSAGLRALLAGSGLSYSLAGDSTIEITRSVITTASSNGKVHFDIPVTDLGHALALFSDQAGIRVNAPPTLADGLSSTAIRGDLVPLAAIRTLIRGTGLAAQRSPDGSISLSRAGASKSARAGESGSQPGNSAERVLIEGERLNTYEAGGNVDITRTTNDEQPYYMFDSETIEESGALNVEEFLKQRLTMNTVAQSNSQGYGTLNGAPMGNTSSINLRGLGTNETLILVDGHRIAGVSVQGTSGQPDVNGIPLAAIDRIEVLPSSASGIYGASAVGGVINIILKKNYNGGDFRYSYDNVTSGSAPTSTLDGSYGSSFEDGKTQVMLTAHYSDSRPLLLQDRQGLVESGINTLLRVDPTALLNPFSPFLGGTTPNISSATYDANGNPLPLTLKNGQPLNSPLTHICSGISPATSTALLNACLAANAGNYDLNLSPGVGEFGLQQPLGYVPRVESLLGTVRRQMTAWLDAFAEVTVEKNDSSSVYNPIADDTFYVPASAPTNPFQNGVLIHFPVNVTTPLIGDSLTRSITMGLTGRLPGNWSSELDYTWSENSFRDLYSQVNNDLIDGIAGQDVSGVTGALVTGTLNPFVDTGRYPPNVAPYVYPTSYGSSSTLNDIALRVTGPLLNWSWGSPTIAAALEHRQEGFPTSDQVSTYNTPSTAIFNNYTEYFGQHQSTNSLYAESTIPLITQKNGMPGLRLLEFQIADRIERYNVATGTASETVTPDAAAFASGYPGYPGAYVCYSPSVDAACQIPVPKATTSYQSNNNTLGVKYKPIDEITVRGSFGTAFLPPTYSQLLPNPMIVPDGDTITDPKTGATYAVNAIYGGNSSLKPEHDKNWDVGIIYAPLSGALQGLRVDLEWYQITQFDAIVGVNGNQILSDPALADRVTRSPTTGLITLINESSINANEMKNEGFDLSADYVKPTSIGSFEFIGMGTLTEHNYLALAVDSPRQELVGYVRLGGQPKTKANGTLNWRYRQWKLGWTTRWLDSYDSLYPSTGEPIRIPVQVYSDSYASYTFDSKSGHLLANLAVELGINDIFNTEPPFDPNFAPFYRSPYESLNLREYRLGIHKGF
jgi:outer membrane receptor protein involved in Fe transport